MVKAGLDTYTAVQGFKVFSKSFSMDTVESSLSSCLHDTEEEETAEDINI